MKAIVRSWKKLSCLVFCMVLLCAGAASADPVRTADPITLDSWSAYIGADANGVLNTEYVGSVWTDKSVMIDRLQRQQIDITPGENNFLVALSAVGATSEIQDSTTVPVDTVLVLDVSGSMNANNKDVAEELVTSANQAVQSLLDMNPYNRVGVVLYSGSSSVLLPLDHYTTTDADGKYFQYSYNTWNNYKLAEYIAVDDDVRNSDNRRVDDGTTQFTGGTYMQSGIYRGMQMLTDGSNNVTVQDPQMGTLTRRPVMVFMTDGDPTYGHTSFTAPSSPYNFGSGSSTSSALGFVTQLTAAYAKQQLQVKYNSEPLIYTVGLQVDENGVARSVLDPAKSSDAINEFWGKYQILATGGTVLVEAGSRNNPDKVVAKISTELNQQYVNQFFSADDGDDLVDQFEQIVGQIQLQSAYHPTLVQGSAELSGYVSFVDRIGQYMEVKNVHGIVIGGVLHTGELLAENFVPGGGKLGTAVNPEPLGTELVNSIKERLGISADQVGSLFSLAHQYGQLSYDPSTGAFSNYVGWYANGDGNICGFWHEGDTNPPANAKYAIKSYIYLGDTDAVHGVQDSDMMHTIVRVQKNLETGEELVSFAVPAALLPLNTYKVELGANHQVKDLSMEGTTRPIRLIYEVGLREGINEHTLSTMVDSAYLAENTQSGQVHFYTNQYEKDDSSVGYGKNNTYSYFRPSRQNDRYYYLKDTPVLVKQGNTYVPYTGSAQPSAGTTYYRQHTIYEKDASGAHTHTGYHELSPDVLSYTLKNENASGRYIPAGTVHMNMHDFDVVKSQNLTGTLPYVNKPYLDLQNANDPATYRYVVSSTLGNNGRLSLPSTAGIVIRKTVDEADPSTTDRFLIRLQSSDANDDGVYPVYTVKADGSASESTPLTFANGQASLYIHHGDTVYVNGMPTANTYTLTELETAKYKLVSINGETRASVTLTPSATQAPVAHFVNALRGTGSLTISKLVEHPFGTDYVIPADKTFEIQVDLDGIGTANATFAATGTVNNRISTDADGKFTLTLGHNEQVTLSGLPVGTTATVTEPEPGTGFTPVYLENGVASANANGTATVAKDTISSVTVKNTYQPSPATGMVVQPRVQKLLQNADGTSAAWQNGYEFTFHLEQHVGETLNRLDTATADNEAVVNLNALAGASYPTAGQYYYRFIEDTTAPIDNIVYDHTAHGFVVVVGDEDMDGFLEIAEIRSARNTVEVDGTTVTATFVNHVGDWAEVTIPIQKHVTNESGSPLAHNAGFTFALYKDAACTELVQESAPTNSRGFTRMVLSYKAQEMAVGEYTHHYWLKEINQGKANWTYDEKLLPITIQVTVSNNATGTAKEIEALIWNGHDQTPPSGASATLGEIPFTNVYAPTAAKWQLNVNKVLENQPLSADMFTFQLMEANGKVLYEASNDADGNVVFDALTFDKVGIYSYRVKELAKGNGYITDENIYRIDVTVTDDNGQLKASHVVLNTADNSITFRNVYDPQDVTHTIQGSKVLTGRSMLNDEFDFVLCEVAADGTSTELQTVGNTLKGTFAFDAITYTLPGEHHYTVREVVDEHREDHHGLVYDRTVFDVYVTVTDPGNGVLEVSQQIATANASASAIQFTNQYIPNPTTATITGEKNLRGLPLQPGQFTFQLYLADDNCNPIELLEELKNPDASGTFSFKKLTYDHAGKWHYVVKEVGGGQIIDGITYDSMDYHVTVTVTDNGLAQLSPTVVAHDQYHIPQEGVEFVNTFGTLGESKITLQGNKVLNGRNLQDGEFTFELYETAADYVVPEGAVPFMTAQNQQDLFTFELEYTDEHKDQAFYYVLREKNAGETIDYVTYSEEEYHIMVEVDEARGDDGVLETITVIRINDEVTPTILFTNEYNAPASTLPSTGDRNTPILWLALAVGSALMAAAHTKRRRVQEG